MRIAIILDLHDEQLADAYGFGETPDAHAWGEEWDDAVAALDARLSEAGYFGPHNLPVAGRVVGAANLGPEGLTHLLNSAEVGLEGCDETDLVGGIVASLREV